MDSGRTWRIYLAVLGVLVGGTVGVQFAGLRAADLYSRVPQQPLLRGDWFVRQALSGIRGIDVIGSYRRAIQEYALALPSAAAARRIGIIRESILGESGAGYFRRLVSPDAVRGLDPSEVAELHTESAMWLRIYGGKSLSAAEAEDFAKRISMLDTGPVGSVAVAEAYRRAGDQEKAGSQLRRARAAAARSVVAATVFGAVLAAGAAAGLVIAVLFLLRSSHYRQAAPLCRIQPPVLMIGFFAYYASLILLGAVMLGVQELAGLEGDTWTVLLQGFAVAGALALGWSALKTAAVYSGENLADMGLRLLPVRHALKWGIGGYLASLPFVGAALLVWNVLSQTVFRNLPTPEQPFGPVIAEGGAAGIAIVFILAAVVAPVAEEVFFRGALYSALRSRMHFWPAALLSAVVFAAAHPLPGGFLPILVLACVLALLREHTGSLIPAMMCHSLYNSVVLVFFLLVT